MSEVYLLYLQIYTDKHRDNSDLKKQIVGYLQGNNLYIF